MLLLAPRMLILSPPCFVSCLQLLATPAHVPLLASLSASGCLLSPGACVASSSSRMSAHCGAVSAGWAGNTGMQFCQFPSVPSWWLNVCADQCGVLLCSGDALGCLHLFEQTSFLPSTPLLTHRQTPLWCVWQQSTTAGSSLVFIGPHTGSWSVSQVVWIPSGCCGHTQWGVRLLGKVMCHQHTRGTGTWEEDGLSPVCTSGLPVLLW